MAERWYACRIAVSILTTQHDEHTMTNYRGTKNRLGLRLSSEALHAVFHAGKVSSSRGKQAFAVELLHILDELQVLRLQELQVVHRLDPDLILQYPQVLLEADVFEPAFDLVVQSRIDEEHKGRKKSCERAVSRFVHAI